MGSAGSVHWFTEVTGTLHSGRISNSQQVLGEKGVHLGTGLFVQKHLTALFKLLLPFPGNNDFI